MGLVAGSVDGELRVAAEDTGSGLPLGRRSGCSRRSGATPGARPCDGNAGLGLSIARGLVEAHGGRVWAENRSDGGARVAFALPLLA